MRRRAYSHLEYLAYAVWLNHETRQRHMTMFTAYFDASGSPSGTSVLFVSGFVASMEKWLRFETEWAALLDEFDIKGYFHMREFAPGVGQYASWKNDLAKRIAFLSEAIRIIKRRTNKSFSSGVIIGDLNKVKRQYILPGFMNFPYSLCSMSIILDVSAWISKQVDKHGRRHDRIKFVFEKGDAHSGILTEELDRLGIRITPIFLTKEECSPFQIADLLAWEHARLTRDSISGSERPRRGSLEAIVKQISGREDWGFHNEKSLVQHCTLRDFPRRDG